MQEPSSLSKEGANQTDAEEGYEEGLSVRSETLAKSITLSGTKKSKTHKGHKDPQIASLEDKAYKESWHKGKDSSQRQKRREDRDRILFPR